MILKKQRIFFNYLVKDFILCLHTFLKISKTPDQKYVVLIIKMFRILIRYSIVAETVLLLPESRGRWPAGRDGTDLFMENLILKAFSQVGEIFLFLITI